MTTSVPANTGEHALEEPSFPVNFVTDLLKAFVQGCSRAPALPAEQPDARARRSRP